MYCPIENCIHDSYAITGQHVCAYSKCTYPDAYKAALRRAIRKLEKLPHLDFKRAVKLVRLQTALLESG